MWKVKYKKALRAVTPKLELLHLFIYLFIFRENNEQFDDGTGMEY